MTFTGTLIDDLIATVERAEQALQSTEGSVTDSLIADSWFASTQENDTKILGVA